MTLLTIPLALWIIYWMFSWAAWLLKALLAKLAQARSRKRQTEIFDSNYIEVKAFYLQEFGALPCVSYINNLDVNKTFEYISAGNAGRVVCVYQSNYYSWHNKKQEFSRTL